MVIKKKQRSGSITGRFRKPGRSLSAVLSKTIRKATREVQVDRIQALLKTGLTPREAHAKLKAEFGKQALSVHTVIYYRRKALSGPSKTRPGRPSKKKGIEAHTFSKEERDQTFHQKDL